MLFLLGIALLSFAADADAQIYRCGNTYSHQPCQGGREIDASPAVSNLNGPSTTVIYLCRATQGALFWIPEPCAKRGWTIERTERVPANVPWEAQLAAARTQRDEAARTVAPPPVYYPTAPQAPSRKEQCAAYDAEVARLDAMGRAGSLHYNLEWIRERRREVRDAQFRLRC